MSMTWNCPFADPAHAVDTRMLHVDPRWPKRNKTKIITEFIKSSWIILKLLEIIYLKDKIIIIAIEWYLKQFVKTKI